MVAFGEPVPDALFVPLRALGAEPPVEVWTAGEDLLFGSFAIASTDAMERIARIRQTDKHHHFTLVCRDLSEIARYARVNNQQYRILKAFTPGPYTFILQATRETPKRLQNPKRRTIGILEARRA